MVTNQCTQGYEGDKHELNILAGNLKIPSNATVANSSKGDIWLYFSILFRQIVGKSKFSVLLCNSKDQNSLKYFSFKYFLSVAYKDEGCY